MPPKRTKPPSEETSKRIKHRRSLTFACLPKELRDYIWELAIENQEGLPEAHFFSTRRHAVACYQSTTIRPACNAWTHIPTRLVPVGWNYKKAPRSDFWQRNCMSVENDSAYLLTGLLWNICVESREAIIRNWRRRNAPNFSCRNVDNWVFVGDKYQFFLAMRPEEDLLCSTAENIPFLHRSIRTRRPKNFGIFIDDAWLTPRVFNSGRVEKFPALEQLKKFCRTADADHIFWLIDPGFKVKERVDFDETTLDYTVFRGHHHVYVECVGGMWVYSKPTNTDRYRCVTGEMLYSFCRKLWRELRPYKPDGSNPCFRPLFRVPYDKIQLKGF